MTDVEIKITTRFKYAITQDNVRMFDVGVQHVPAEVANWALKHGFGMSKKKVQPARENKSVGHMDTAHDSHSRKRRKSNKGAM